MACRLRGVAGALSAAADRFGSAKTQWQPSGRSAAEAATAGLPRRPLDATGPVPAAAAFACRTAPA